MSKVSKYSHINIQRKCEFNKYISESGLEMKLGESGLNMKLCEIGLKN